MKALVTARLSIEAEEFLAERFDAIQYKGWRETHKRLSTQELVNALNDVEVFITEFDFVSGDILAIASKLCILACCRGGPEANVDLDAATQLGIPVIYTPGRNAITVAEFTFGLLFSLIRHISTTDYLLKKTDQLTEGEYVYRKPGGRTVVSEWSLDAEGPFIRYSGSELFRKTLGIVGFGDIGREVALRALAFQMDIMIYDPFVLDADIIRYGARPVDLGTLLRESDIVTLHCNVTQETRGIISTAQLDLMKPTAYLINTARAEIVDYAALYTTLRERRIAGAGLDVYECEPLQSDNPLLKLDNVVLTPHIAGATRDVPWHHSKMLMRNLTCFFQSRRPVHLANPDVWERRRSRA